FKAITFTVFLLLIPVATCTPAFIPVDCNDIYEKGYGNSGVYNIYPAGPVSPVQVYCDMDGKSEGTKWTVIQRRMDGTVNFYRGWEQYKAGFGQASGEYWLGLNIIHILTMRKNYELRVEMEDFAGAKVFAHYTSFSVGPEEEGYKLSFSGFVDGGAGNSLSEHNGQMFSTFDKDQDSHSSNCAKTFLGGWWYGECHSVNPNGMYLWGSSASAIGINWVSWKGYEYSLKAISMKIRPSKHD
uniref:Microfibril associated protein 4 n=2 Tax=Neogobius melanostomus TaxID=47308 RepID=A0A8C6WI58_9GOBI